MRIVHLNPFYFPYAGGIERRILALSRRLAPKHEVHVVTARLPGTIEGASQEDGFTVHRLPSRFPLKSWYNPPPVRTLGLDAKLKELDPDVVDFHFRWSRSYSRSFRKLRRAGRVITYHNTYGEGLGALGLLSRLNDRLYMRTVRRADRVLCVSDCVRRDLLSRRVETAKLHLSHNAVETADIERVKGAPKTHINGPFVVSVGRVVALKGFDVLIDAWPNVPRDLHLVIVGMGPLIPKLQRRTERLGVRDRVHFTGWTEEDEKTRLLKAAVAYAHPARFESFPFALLEALAAGAPIVAANVGGIPEVVGDAGQLLPHEPAAWADALRALAEDDDLQARKRKASRERSRRFDWDRITHDLEAHYEAVAKR